MLHIKDIDGLTTKEEVMEAVEREIGAIDKQYRVGELRPFYGGSQAVTVWTSKAAAESLMEKRFIKIGLSWCRTIEWLEVIQCYKCWSYGHRRHECKEEEDYSQACRTCGSMYHKEKDCDGQSCCMLCKTEDHKTGSGRCKEFKEALRRARLENRR